MESGLTRKVHMPVRLAMVIGTAIAPQRSTIRQGASGTRVIIRRVVNSLLRFPLTANHVRHH